MPQRRNVAIGIRVEPRQTTISQIDSIITPQPFPLQSATLFSTQNNQKNLIDRKIYLEKQHYFDEKNEKDTHQKLTMAQKKNANAKKSQTKNKKIQGIEVSSVVPLHHEFY